MHRTYIEKILKTTFAFVYMYMYLLLVLVCTLLVATVVSFHMDSFVDDQI